MRCEECGKRIIDGPTFRRGSYRYHRECWFVMRDRRRRDYADGAAGKEKGMEDVYEHADSDWKTVADECVRDLALRQEFITSEDVRRAVAKTGVTTHEMRALGPVMMRAARAGLIVKHGFAPSETAYRHQSPLLIWRSTLYEGRV